SPVNPTIPLGQVQRFTATGVLSDGSTEPLTSVTWSTPAIQQTVVAIDSTGLATGVNDGSATINATSGSVRGSTAVTVLYNLRSISVSPVNPLISTGTTQQFEATLGFSDDSFQTVTSVNWSSSAPAVATIGPTGLVSGVGAGTTTITATVGSFSGSTA